MSIFINEDDGNNFLPIALSNYDNVLYNIPSEDEMNQAISTWEPFWLLPDKAIEFMRFFRNNNHSQGTGDIYSLFDKWQTAISALLMNERFHISLKTGKVIHSYEPPSLNGYRCEGCGNDYDGYAQCDCPQSHEIYQLYP